MRATVPNEWAGSIQRRNRAYLVSVHDVEGDSTHDEYYDAAANLNVAKRLLRSMAEAFNFRGHHRWEETVPGLWNLYFDRWEEEEATDPDTWVTRKTSWEDDGA